MSVYKYGIQHCKATQEWGWGPRIIRGNMVERFGLQYIRQKRVCRPYGPFHHCQFCTEGGVSTCDYAIPERDEPVYREVRGSCSWHFSGFGCYELVSMKSKTNPGHRVTFDNQLEFQEVVNNCEWDANLETEQSPFGGKNLREIGFPDVPRYMSQNRNKFKKFFNCFI